MRLLAALLVLVALVTGCAADEVVTLSAVLPNANNLYVGSEARVLGLRVGEVTALEPLGQDVVATMRLDPGIVLPSDVSAIVTPESLLGQRYVQLDPPYQGGPVFPDGGVIPRERTAGPAELDDVLESFDDFLSQLDPDGLAELVDVLAQALEGQGSRVNHLLDNGATTVRVLRDASDDLNGVVDRLGDLNTTVATRDEQIGRTLEDFATVLQTLNGENDDIVDGVGNLRRLTANLRPITAEHADPLVTDLETLTTTLATVDRNLDRVGDVIRGGRLLFEGSGRAFDFPTARLRLDDELLATPDAILLRLRERLVGVCLRLEEPACADPAFWEPVLPELVCTADCGVDKPTLAQAIRDALAHLPPGALARLETEAGQRAAQAPEEPTAVAPTPEPAPPAATAPRVLPAPPPPPAPGPPALRERLAELLGGGG